MTARSAGRRNTRARIARLRLGRDRADFDRTKPQRGKRRNRFGILVKTRSHGWEFLAKQPRRRPRGAGGSVDAGP